MMKKVEKNKNVPQRLPGETFLDYRKRTNQ